MLQRIVTHINVTYSEQTGQTVEYHFVGGSTRAPSRKTTAPLERTSLQKVIDQYWEYVRGAISGGLLEAEDGVVHEDFIGQLESRGNEIARTLFSKEQQTELWAVAAQSDIVLINTNLDEVPWEALFCPNAGEDGEFFSQNCVIQRQIFGDDFEADIQREEPNSWLICLDPELVREEEAKGWRIVDELERHALPLYTTSNSRELAKRVKGSALIHWICEHDLERGLRLGRDVFYSDRDIETHRFPPHCLLFMLSCSTGRSGAGMAAFSSRIASASGCTVVAPSSVVAAQEAVGFVASIHRILEDRTVEQLCDVWTLLKNPLGGRRVAGRFSVQECYLLWFGIYGDCGVSIGTRRPADGDQDRAA